MELFLLGNGLFVVFIPLGFLEIFFEILENYKSKGLGDFRVGSSWEFGMLCKLLASFCFHMGW